MKKMDGKLVAQTLKDHVKKDVQSLKKQGIHPSLCVVLAGDDPASKVYVKRKMMACDEVGIHSKLLKFPKDVPQEELIQTLESLNQDPLVHGILVQLPLPGHLDQKTVLSYLSPKKDVDVLTTKNVGALWSSSANIQPCTPKGIITMLEHYKIPLEGRHVVVLGRSLIVGRPMVQLLLEKNATVTICHSKTTNLKEHTKRAEVVVVACGKHHLLKAQDFKKGAVVIDVGMHRISKEGKTVLEGDVCPEGLENVLSYFSPVPGGVGPMTISSLLHNTVQLARH
ncbi:MAG: bifunctional methylenetetrahydrofolate dehydrogenase/methenyltetrahydrofolate cyclohydrolase [Bdellovibrionales bacterium]|nr:bifunctional methylenetetrahydrofolate dehydrogenase/methenyltetrahydrofolate cyclohydrolase [Bdellovibrionales bacterium]